VQAALGHPLTVHGTGGQTRAFLNIQDTVRCIALAVAHPPERGDRVKIINQIAESLRVRDLARLVSDLTGAAIEYLPNPRKEAAENDLDVSNATFRALGLDPILLTDGLLAETLEISARYADRVDQRHIPARTAWTREQQAALDQAGPIETIRPALPGVAGAGR
jgi:UDP-sulfoquinovose synthase